MAAGLAGASALGVALGLALHWKRARALRRRRRGIKDYNSPRLRKEAERAG